jgi:hypothetical protein
MKTQLSWKTLLIASIMIATPQLAHAKKAKEKPTMFQVVERFLAGQPTPNAVLKIKVYDEDSQPLSGAVVKLKRRETGEDKTLRTTDSAGATENNAAKNDYEIEVSKPGYALTSKYIVLDKGMSESFVLKKLAPEMIAGHGDRMPASALDEIEDIE